MAARFAASTGVVTAAFTWDATAGVKWALTSGGIGGQAVPGSSDDVTFDNNTASASYTATRSVTTALRSLTLKAPSSGTLAFANTRSMTLGAGGLTIAASGVSASGWTGTVTCSTSCALDANGAALGAPLTISGSGITVTMGSAFSTTGAVSVSIGTLAMNGKLLTAGNLSTSAGTGTLNFGTGGTVVINVASAGGTALNLAGTTTNPGSVTVNVGTFSTTVSAGASGIGLTLAGGSGAQVTTLTGSLASLSFSGYTSSVSIGAAGLAVSNLIIPTGLGGGSGGWNNASGSLTVSGTLVTNGRTISNTLIVGASLTLGSDVAANTFWADAQTVALGAYNLTADNWNTSTSGSPTTTITSSGGRFKVSGGGGSFGLTTFPAGFVIECINNVTHVLQGINSSNVTVLNTAGTTRLSNCATIGTIQSSTGEIQLEATKTTVVTNVTLSNCSLRSDTAGSAATLSKASGTVTFTGMTIKDMNFTGGATFLAYTSDGNVDGGNNTGITFTAPNTGNFFLM